MKKTLQQPFSLNREGKEAVLILYGDIVSHRPVDWWTGEEMPGNFIILDEVLEELEALAGVEELTVRIHSLGGNAYDAITIHNRLEAMPAQVRVVVDGVAMSGGAVIMNAGDIVEVYPGSLVMIHDSWGVICGGYNAKELHQEAERFEATDRAMSALFSRRTGKSEEEIRDMMGKTTYMTGQEAVDMGFADTVVEGKSLEISASADRKKLFVGGHQMVALARGGVPPQIPLVAPVAQATEPIILEGGETMTKEELKAKHPDLVGELEAEASAQAKGDADGAVQNERERLSEIDKLAHLFSVDEVMEAKYGANPCTAQELTYRAAQAAAQKGTAFLGAMEGDVKASGAMGVKGAVAPVENDTQPKTAAQEMEQARQNMKALLGKKEG